MTHPHHFIEINIKEMPSMVSECPDLLNRNWCRLVNRSGDIPVMDRREPKPSRVRNINHLLGGSILSFIQNNEGVI